MKSLKNALAIIALVFVTNSCSLDDSDSNFYFEALEIVEVTLPETFTLGEIYEIGVTYLRPTTCHGFSGFDYEWEAQTERTVAAIAVVANETNCEELTTDNEFTATFNFEVRYTGTYKFNFFAGKDANGNNEFIVREVPVVE